MENLIKKLRKNGMRVTDQRKAVLLFLSGQETSISIKELYLSLSKKGVKIDEASVYRIIEAFKDLSVVHTHGDGRINLCSHQSCSHSFHYSIECPSCKKVSEPKLSHEEEKGLAKIFNLKVDSVQHIQVNAKCKTCD